MPTFIESEEKSEKVCLACDRRIASLKRERERLLMQIERLEEEVETYRKERAALGKA